MPGESGGEKQKHRSRQTESEMEPVVGAIRALEVEVDGFHGGENRVAGGPVAWGKENPTKGVGGAEDEEEIRREAVRRQIGKHGLCRIELGFAGQDREFRM